MSTIQKFLKNEKIQLLTQNLTILEYISYFTIGFFAVGARLDDYRLVFLSLVLAFSSKSKTESICMVGGALLASGYLSMSDNYFLPFFLALVSYLVVYVVLNSHLYAKSAALIFLTAGKILFVYFYLDLWYKILAFLQSALIFYLSELVEQGREEISKHNIYRSFQSQLSVFLLCASYILSFSGVGLLYWSISVTICFLWLSIKLNRTDLTYIFIFFTAVTVSDRLNFAYLLLLFSASGISGGLFVGKNEKLFFTLPPITALLLNIAFMGQVIGFAPFATVLMAQLLYLILPHIFIPLRISSSGVIYKSGKDYRQLAQNMEKLTASLDYLANCAVDISKLNENMTHRQSLCDIVSEEICGNCHRNTFCWVDKFSFTNEQFLKLEKDAQRNRQLEFPPGFLSQCEKTDKLLQSFEENNRALLSKKYILQSQKKYMKILQDTILSISGAVAGILTKSQQSQLVNTFYTQNMSDFLSEIKIPYTYCICTNSPDRIVFSSLELVGEELLYKICCKADETYQKTFSTPVLTRQAGEFIYTIMTLPALKFEYSAKSRALLGVNGDKATMFSNGEKLFCILSDGMGTGYYAAGESTTATAMLKSLLLADVEVEYALSITNIVLNLRGGEAGATADILSLDLYTGDVEIFKAGAGETIILNREKIDRFYSESLPLGIVKDIKTKSFSTIATDGDVIVMCTDGIGIVEDDILAMRNNDCKDIAASIINSSTNADDKTVVVIKIKKCT